MIEHRRREPSPGVFRLVLPLPFPGLSRVNAYLLTSGDGATLVDCGIYDPALDGGGWADLVEALRVCDSSPDDIARLVLTHPHIDHYGLAAKVVEETGCEVWMHESAAEDLDMYRDPQAVAFRVREMFSDHGVDSDDAEELSAFEDWRGYISGIVEPTNNVADGDLLEVGDRSWVLVHTPGHAHSHVCLWDAGTRLLISGDHLLASITPHIDFKRGEDEDPLGDYLASLAKVEKLGAEWVLPGHGRPFEDGAARARVIARHHDRRLGSIVQVIRNEARTASEITDEIFGTTLLNFQRRLALGEALAHLAYLRHTGEIERVERDGVYLYKKESRRPSGEDDE